MMEFIVLGQIPGLSWQVTLNWVLSFVAIVLSLYEVRMRLHYWQHKLKAQSAEQLAI